ncbi:hypothetical protein V8C35DRAFT_52699 [Trichoderma chlorosporum]
MGGACKASPILHVCRFLTSQWTPSKAKLWACRRCRSTTKQIPMSELRMLTDALGACLVGESFRVVLSARGVLHGRPSASTPKMLTAAMKVAALDPTWLLYICVQEASAVLSVDRRRAARQTATANHGGFAEIMILSEHVYLDGGRNTTRLVVCWECGRNVSPDLARGSGSYSYQVRSIRRTDFTSVSWCHAFHGRPVLPTTLG